MLYSKKGTMISSIRFLVIIGLLLLSCNSAVIYIPGVPVNSMTLYQLQVACDQLQNNLNSDPTLSNSFKVYADTYLANYFLQKIANDPGIAAYNNVIYGDGNQIHQGNKNIVFGTGNSLKGSYNYVFSQNFDSSQVSSGNISNNLVLDDWLIRLLKMYMIPFNPHSAVEQWQ